MKNSDKQFLESDIIKIYFSIRKLPSFAILNIKKQNKSTSKLVILRYFKDGFIYYNSICDLNVSKDINFNEKVLNVIKIYSKIKNYHLNAINNKLVKEITDIDSDINKTLLFKFYKKECEKR